MAKNELTQAPPLSSSEVMSLPQPPNKKSAEYLKAYTGYAYTAISAIAQEVASIELRLFSVKFSKKGREIEEVPEHPALSLLRFVNPLSTFPDLVEATQVYLELTGEAYWVVLKDGKNPKEIWPLRPDWISIVPSKTEVIDHYLYKPGGSASPKEAIKIPKENMIPFKYFNPLNPYRGKGSVQAAAMPLDTHTFAQEYNRNFFFNSAIPSLVFTTEKRLNEKVIKRFMNQWQANFGGRTKSNKIAFLGNGFKVSPISQGAKDMDFKEQQRVMRDDILAVFRVPKTILGLTDDVNRSNADATTLAFMERVVTPRDRKFVGTLNEFLLPMYDDDSLFFDFVDPSPVDVELKLKRYANARKYGWMTPNEVRAEENLEPLDDGDSLVAAGSKVSSSDDEVETGEEDKGLSRFFGRKKKKELTTPIKRHPKPFKHMMPLPVKKLDRLDREKLAGEITGDLKEMIGKMMELENTVEIEKRAQIEKDNEVAEEPLMTEEEKTAHWKRFIEFADIKEAEMRETAIKLFKEQEAVILDNLEGVKYWRSHLRKGKESSVLQKLEDMSKIWISTFVPIVREAVIEQGNFTLDFLSAGGRFDISSPESVRFLETEGAELVTAINETTREALRATLAEGFELGESIVNLRNRVEEVFTTATRSRATMIARTESIRAANFGTVEAYRQSEVVIAKEWLTERDDRVCPWCLSMDGKIVDLDKDYFKIGDTLDVDGKVLEIKLTDVGYPPLHPQCRCTTIPVIIGTKMVQPEKEVVVVAVDEDAELEKRKEAAKKKAREIIRGAKEEGEIIVDDAKEQANSESIVIIDAAVESARKEDAEAVERVRVVLDKAEEDKRVAHAKKFGMEIKKTEVLKEAEEIAQEVVKEAKVAGEKIIQKSEKKAKKEAKGILGELVSLRDKARKALWKKAK